MQKQQRQENFDQKRWLYIPEDSVEIDPEIMEIVELNAPININDRPSQPNISAATPPNPLKNPLYLLNLLLGLLHNLLLEPFKSLVSVNELLVYHAYNLHSLQEEVASPL